jgi:hypothetical protein
MNDRELVQAVRTARDALMVAVREAQAAGLDVDVGVSGTDPLAALFIRVTASRPL